MKALLHTEPYRFLYTDVPMPEVGPEDVLVRVAACGICGSDVHGYTGATGRRIPPLVMGHEAAGVVEQEGADVPADAGLAPGTRVCMDSTVYCNRCAACRAGQYNRCERRQVLGVSTPGMKRQGAFAEFVAVPWWILAPLPEGMDFEQAALLEPVSIGVHAVNRGDVGEGDVVLVIGAGTIGLFILQAARLKGARVYMSDPDASRRELARRLGAEAVFDPRADDLNEAVRGRTDGRGVDVAFEAVGYAATLQQAAACTRMGGTVVAVGNLEKSVPLDVQDLVARELTLRGTYASSGEYRSCIALVAEGRIDVRPLISGVLTLADGQAAFDRLREGRENLLKLILRPGEHTP